MVKGEPHGMESVGIWISMGIAMFIALSVGVQEMLYEAEAEESDNIIYVVY